MGDVAVFGSLNEVLGRSVLDEGIYVCVFIQVVYVIRSAGNGE